MLSLVCGKLIEVILQIWINAYTYAKFKILKLGPKSFVPVY